MSVAGLSAAAAALWPALRRIVRRIGRWLLVRLIEYGYRWVLGYMRVTIEQRFPNRIEDCIEFAARARTESRKRRLRMKRRRIQRRLARWKAVAAWIADNAHSLKSSVLRQFARLADEIPSTPPWERN